MPIDKDIVLNNDNFSSFDNLISGEGISITNTDANNTIGYISNFGDNTIATVANNPLKTHIVSGTTSTSYNINFGNSGNVLTHNKSSLNWIDNSFISIIKGIELKYEKNNSYTSFTISTPSDFSFFIDNKNKKVFLIDNQNACKEIELKKINIQTKKKDYVSHLKSSRKERKLLCEKIKKPKEGFVYWNGLEFYLGGYGNIVLGNNLGTTLSGYQSIALGANTINVSGINNVYLGDASSYYTSYNNYYHYYLDGKTKGLESEKGNLYIDLERGLVFQFDGNDWIENEIENIEYDFNSESSIEYYKAKKLQKTLLCEKIKKQDKKDKYYYDWNKYTSFIGGIYIVDGANYFNNNIIINGGNNNGFIGYNNMAYGVASLNNVSAGTSSIAIGTTALSNYTFASL